MTTYALEFHRLTGRDMSPKFSRIPADTTPAEEIAAFMSVMKKVGAKVREITAGVEWVVNLTEARQIYKVRLVELDDEDTAVDMMAVILYDEHGNELDSSDRAR
jgi:hypothetical protein